jgi:hypothetical protein
MKLLFTYGTLLNRKLMNELCPASIPWDVSAEWRDHRLEFSYFPTVRASQGASLPGGFYEITRKCERELDLYENFPQTYAKISTRIPFNGVWRDVLAYQMIDATPEPPGEMVIKRMIQGYRDWNLDSSIIADAIEATEKRCA